jgi:prepilin-type N-terminal cleavage/methylation domain-containing protein
MTHTSPAKACRRIRQNAGLRRALASTPTSQGFALLEILLAIALFALVSVGMTQAIDGIAKTTTAARQEAQVLRVLESVLAEVAHQPEFKATKIDFPKTADHIDASATIEKVRLFTRDKAELDHVFRVRAEAWISDGTSRRIVRTMETYVYSPNSPI